MHNKIPKIGKDLKLIVHQKNAHGHDSLQISKINVPEGLLA